MLPSLPLLEKISKKIKNIPNRKKENKRRVHYGCYLLCSQSGLRISEAVKFNLNSKTRQGLYRITKPKGKKERLVYIPKKVIRELKKHNWQPNQTNRHNFYHFLKKVKRELGISKSIELSPHTLRRAFTTYHAEAGLPLPLLSKLLGHSSIRTTALYWRNIYGDGDNDPSDILTGKKWLERQESSQKELSKPPTTKNFPLSKTPKPIIIKNKSTFTTKKPLIKPNSPLFTEIAKKPAITDSQLKPSISGIPSKTPANIPLNIISEKKEFSQQLPLITNQGEQPTDKEQILLKRIKWLEEQLRKIRALVQTEKQRADKAEQQLRKFGYYQQLEQEQNKAQIIQLHLLKLDRQ